MKVSQIVFSALGGGALLGLVYRSIDNSIQSSRRLRLNLDESSLHAAMGASGKGSFSVLNPDPEDLIWDEEPPEGYPNIRLGWLRVPLHYDHELANYEPPPSVCLRVAVRPARLQPARLGPILLHEGGPISDVNSIWGWMGRMMEINSSYVAGPPLSDDYDYWSISQRGMAQAWFPPLSPPPEAPEKCPFEAKPWPETICSGILGMLNKTHGVQEILKLLDGSPDMATWDNIILPVLQGPSLHLFGVPFYNETYVTWAYRLLRLHYRLCVSEETFSIKSPSGRNYNLLKYTGTANLANDIEVFRKAIGATKMSIFGHSYGTMVGGVYATMFPSKVHRLVLDGDMGRHPDMASFATWDGESVENVWAGLARACDESGWGGSAGSKRCAAAPGAARKLQGLFQGKDTEKAFQLFKAFRCIYSTDVPCAVDLMDCVAALDSSNTSSTACKVQDEQGWPSIFYESVHSGLKMAQVLGVDYAGHFTEQSFLQWWRSARMSQPLGITRSLSSVAFVDAWPVLPRPPPPVGTPVVAPLIIGNLFDAQTAYQNAQHMLEAFPNGALMTWQGYGHGLNLDQNISNVVKQYEEEMEAGKRPSYTNDVAKLLCVRMMMLYLRNGTLPLAYVCKAAAPAQTGDVLEL